jgi:predicted ester cyclase
MVKNVNEKQQLTRNLFHLIDEMQGGRAPWSRFDDVVTPDFKAFVPGQTLDIEGFKQVMQTFGQAFSDSSHTIFDVVCDGDVAMVREEWQGTHTGLFVGAEPTRKRVSSLVMCLLRFSGEKVSEFHETFDTLSLMQQTGVIKEKA